MKVTAAVTESSIDADDERTCFTQTPRVSGRTLAGEAVDQVCARASVLARMWGTFIDVYGGKKQNELFYVLFCVFFKLVSRTTKKKCGQQLTNLTSSTAETSQTRASEGGVARNAVVDALASVQAGPQVRTHWCCREREELQGIGHEGMHLNNENVSTRDGSTQYSGSVLVLDRTSSKNTIARSIRYLS